MTPLVTLFALFALALGSVAHAADVPTWTADTSLGATGWPTGVRWDNRLEAQAPLYRSKSILFQDTFAGAGLRLTATPAFTQIGPRIEFAPIDVFNVTFEASWVDYFARGGVGLLPYDEPRGKLERIRFKRGDESLTGGAFSLTVAPTVMGRLGPVMGAYGWTISRLWILPGAKHSSPYVYEPYRDLVVGWKDWTLEQQGAVLYEVLPGGDRAMFRAGATARDRHALVSGDRSTTVGAVVMARPGTKIWVPTLAGQLLWYVKDADRVGPIPSMGLMASWRFERPIRSAGRPSE